MRKIAAYAKKQGYKRAELAGEWQGWQVYRVFFQTKEEERANPRAVFHVGAPRYILVRGDEIRLTDYEEGFSVMMALPDNGDDEEEDGEQQ